MLLTEFVAPAGDFSVKHDGNETESSLPSKCELGRFQLLILSIIVQSLISVESLFWGGEMKREMFCFVLLFHCRRFFFTNFCKLHKFVGKRIH